MPLPALVKAYNVFIDGVGYAGKAECEPPGLEITTEDYSAGGMSGVAKVDMGRVEPIQLKWTLYEHVPDVLERWGLIDGRAVSVTLRSAQQTDRADRTDEIHIEAEGQCHMVTPGAWESASKDASKLEYEMNCRSYKLSVANEDIYEVDVERMIRIIRGTDQMEALRTVVGAT